MTNCITLLLVKNLLFSVLFSDCRKVRAHYKFSPSSPHGFIYHVTVLRKKLFWSLYDLYLKDCQEQLQQQFLLSFRRIPSPISHQSALNLIVYLDEKNSIFVSIFYVPGNSETLRLLVRKKKQKLNVNIYIPHWKKSIRIFLSTQAME